MTSDDIQKLMKSRWYWVTYLRKRGLMKQPKPFNSAEYAERWLKKIQNHTHTSTGSFGNRYRIIRDSGGRETMEYAGNSQNYCDPVFDVS